MDNQSDKLNKNKFEREDSRFDLDNDERERRKSFHPRHNSLDVSGLKDVKSKIITGEYTRLYL